jgi:hypothetical protein
MKRNISIVMLTALLITVFAACNNSGAKNESSTVQTDTSYLHPIILADSTGLHHIMETGEVYTCVMHHGVISDKPGACPTCGMTLVKQKLKDEQKKMLKDRTYTKPKY